MRAPDVVERVREGALDVGDVGEGASNVGEGALDVGAGVGKGPVGAEEGPVCGRTRAHNVECVHCQGVECQTFWYLYFLLIIRLCTHFQYKTIAIHRIARRVIRDTVLAFAADTGAPRS